MDWIPASHVLPYRLAFFLIIAQQKYTLLVDYHVAKLESCLVNWSLRQPNPDPTTILINEQHASVYDRNAEKRTLGI